MEQHPEILSPLICQIQSLFAAFESFQKDRSPILKRLFQVNDGFKRLAGDQMQSPFALHPQQKLWFHATSNSGIRLIFQALAEQTRWAKNQSAAQRRAGPTLRTQRFRHRAALSLPEH
jgi:uncharacterized protein YbgA (DUF1722 family)